MCGSYESSEIGEEPLTKQMRPGANDLEHREELEAIEDQSSDNDSQNGILADDNMKVPQEWAQMRVEPSSPMKILR